MALIQVYVYHDWMSLGWLLWLLHSTLYKKASNFSIAMYAVYLPFFTMTFLWYYTINIYGLIDFEHTTTVDVNYHYNIGLYKFNIPPLEVGFLFLCLLGMLELGHILSVQNES